MGYLDRFLIGGLFSQYSTVEEAVIAVHEKVATNTKNEILTLKTSKVSFILLRPDDTSYDEKWYSTSTGEFLLDFDGSPYVQKLYGTINNPTYGKMYSFTDENIDTVITENIYEDVSNLIQPDMNTVKIVDYFPNEIINNFDFSYVSEPNIGSSSNSIDTESKTITWNIGTLNGEETATLKYKLKIKDMKNTELLGKTIATNEKVVLTYTDTDSKDYTVELTSSPKIQLQEVKEELTATVSYNPTNRTTGNVTATIRTNKRVNNVEGWTLSTDGMTLTRTYSKNKTEIVHLVDVDGMTKDVEVKVNNIISSNGSTDNKKDNTVADGVLPQTGISMTIIISIIAIILIVIVTYRKYNNYKDVK